MIRPCEPRDLPTIHAIINDAARAYRGVIPEDRWHDPYMPLEELRHEIAQGVAESAVLVAARHGCAVGRGEQKIRSSGQECPHG